MKKHLYLVLLVSACESEELTPRPCDPGEMECVADPEHRQMLICNEWGSAWIETACAEDERCVAGDCADPEACPDRCVPVICEAGERYCGSNNIYVYECNEIGTGGCFVESCALPPYDGTCFEGGCLSVCGAGQKSYLGCEYFAVDLDNAFVDCDGRQGGDFCDASAQQFAVVVSNPEPDRIASVIITTGEIEAVYAGAACIAPPLPVEDQDFVVADIVPPKGIRVFKLPARNVNGTVQDKLAYRVASNIPISVYQFNPLENVGVFSNDASMLMPTTAAGRRYFMMSRAQYNDKLRGFMTVVGIADQPTTVTVTTTVSIYPGNGIPRMMPLETRNFELDRFDVLNLEPDSYGADLTGSFVEADRPVIAYSGHEAAVAPTPMGNCDATGQCRDGSACEADIDCGPRPPCCADHLEQQLFPVSTWGREYIAVRSYPRGDEGDVWRVLAAEDGTEVTIDPPVANLSTLGRGEFEEFIADGDFTISASAPILVGQFLTGEQYKNAGTGDPAFMLAVPVRQFRDSYVFLAPGITAEESIGYAEDYVSIAVKMGADARLDGQDLAVMALQRPGFVTYTPIADSGWAAFRAPIEDGFHTLSCPDTCSVMVHGYDQYVSYGYPGGLNLLECTSDNDCQYPTNLCNEDNVCVECLADDDCTDPFKPFCGEGFVCTG